MLFVVDIGSLITIGIILIFLVIELFININSCVHIAKEKKKKDKDIEKTRKLAIKIIEEFEELLMKHNIKIPSEEREDDEDDASIYGIEYYDLEDSIVAILNNNVKNYIKRKEKKNDNIN